MFDSLVAELQFEIDRHNLRVAVAQTRQAQLKTVPVLESESVCMMCLEEVDRSQLDYEFGHIYTQADVLGMDSLTEHQQVVCEGRLCSYDCYESMQKAEFDYEKRLIRAANIEANGDTTFYGGPEGGE